MEDALSLIEKTADLMDGIIEDGPLEKEASTSTEIAYVFGLCVLAFFGTVGNIFILIMFCREELSQTSYSIYIRAAAITDTVFMLLNISEDIIDYATSYKPERFEGTSFGFCVFSVVIHKTALTSSLWIVVALAVDRCVAIWKPLHRTVYCTRKIAVILTAVILLLSLSLELGVALTFSSIVLDDDLKPVCQSFSSDRIIIMVKRLSTETGLPCLAMLLPNLLVIRKIQQSLSFRRRFSTAADLQKKQVAKSARPLLVVSCLAFLTLLPVSITELVEFIKIMNEDMHNQDHFNRNKSVDETFRGRDFDFSNGTLENITRRQFFEEIDQGFRTNMVESIIDDMESRHGIEDMKPENDQEVLNEEGEGDYEEGEGDYEEGDYEEGDYEEEEGDYEEGKDDYEEGEGDYEEGEGDYEEGDYKEGGDDYEEGEGDYEEGEGDYEEGEGDYEEGEVDYEEEEGDYEEGKDDYEEGEGDYEEGDYEEEEGDYEEGGDDYEEGEGDYEEGEGDYEEGEGDYEEGEGDYEEGEGDYEKGDYEEGEGDYEEGEGDYEEGEGDYEEGDYEEGGDDYEEGEEDYEEGEGDYEEGEGTMRKEKETTRKGKGTLKSGK